MGMHLDPIACTGFAGLIRHGIDTHPPSVQASPAQATIASRPTSRGDLDSPSHRGGTPSVYSYTMDMSTTITKKQNYISVKQK